jgi:hypothetical protein
VLREPFFLKSSVFLMEAKTLICTCSAIGSLHTPYAVYDELGRVTSQTDTFGDSTN